MTGGAAGERDGADGRGRRLALYAAVIAALAAEIALLAWLTERFR